MPNSEPTLAIFRNQTFRMLWIATLASNFGGLVQSVGAAWMMTSLSASESMVALVQTSITLPIMIFSLAAGVFADNFDRRRIMLAAQTFMLLVSLGLAVLAYEGLLTPWLLLSFTFLIGCGTALHNPSWQASVGDIVSRAELSAAVSVNSMGFNLMRSVGPAAGGAIVAIAGAAAAFAVNALSYVAIHCGAPQPGARRCRRWASARTLRQRVFGRAALCRDVANLLRVILRGFLFGCSAWRFRRFCRWSYAIARRERWSMASCWAASGSAPSRARSATRGSGRGLQRTDHQARVPRLRGERRPVAERRFLTSAGAVFVAGICWVVSLSLFNVTMAGLVVRAEMALYQTGVFGGMAGGGFGAVAERAGLQGALLGAAAVLVLGALAGLISAASNAGELNLDPLNRFREPPTQLDLTSAAARS